MENNEKKEILEMLAKKEISKEEAEKKLAELNGENEPEQPEIDEMAYQPPPKKNKGCLIAIIIAIFLLPVLLVILGALFFFTMRVTEPELNRSPQRPKTYESSMSESGDYAIPVPENSEIVIEKPEK